MTRYHPLAHRPYRLLFAVLLCFAAALAYGQSAAVKQGMAAYQRGDHPAAVREFQRAIEQNPQGALAYYGLGRAYTMKGNQNFPAAVEAWDQAQRIDPSLSFSRNPTRFREMYAEASQRAERQESPAQSNAPPGLRETIVKDLARSDAYVQPTLASKISEQELEKMAAKYNNPDLKVVVLQDVPPGRDRTPANDRREFAQTLHDVLRLRDGLLVVVEDQGVTAHTAALGKDRMDKLVREHRGTFQTGSVYQGVDQIATATFGRIQTQRQTSQSFWLFVILALAAGVAFFTIKRRAARKHRITTLDRQLRERLAALQDEFKRFDIEIANAPDSPLLQEAKQLRSAAVDPFAEAGELFNRAETVEQYEEVDHVTEQAEKMAAKARIRLDQALGNRPLDESGSGGNIPRMEEVPEEDRGACFFCSKPARLGDLQPIQINVQGDPRRVLACDDCYDIAKTGRQPQVLTVPDEEGRNVPWYESRRYDPWTDYRGGGIFGGGGGLFGGGFGLMDYFLLESLFDHGLRANPTVITPQDPGYVDQYGSDLSGDFAGDAGMGAENDAGGDFFGSLFGGGSDAGSEASGGVFGGDLFGNDSGGDDLFGGDFFGGDSGGDAFDGDFFGD